MTSKQGMYYDFSTEEHGQIGEDTMQNGLTMHGLYY